MADRPNKNDPQAQLRKLERAEDGKKAMADYEAERDAIRIKTEKLKALRLAREATDAANAPKAKAGAKKKAPAKKTKTKKAPLSDWLKDRETGGRNS